MTTLLDILDRHGRRHADANGIATTPIPGVMSFRVAEPSGMSHAIARPLVCLVVQGAKQVTLGVRDFSLRAGESLLISADVPIVSQITMASHTTPYVSLVLELDLAIVAELVREMGPAVAGTAEPVRVDPTDAEVAGAALRLLHLLDRPAALPVLQASLIREMHYWLLAGRHGAAIRRLGWPDSHAQRIGRAVALLRTDYASPVPVARLAEAAGMSPSTFHQHFRAVTSLSPLQFQKQLRLIEARRLMTAEGASASSAAFAVGYESVSQFTREYGRLFGASPVRDVKTAREQVRAA
ncbi:AraC family transcriptional regulator N-terminal domain-containing protein [Ancylobacter sp. IITR112]|uniref:AraC family transcriptional regulator n=1 Tax=Ancylobacter sp. IITR112 TaxID=3138073 RepID=UPI00352AD5B8